MVLGAETEDAKLAEPVRNIEACPRSRSLPSGVEWMACDGCGAWVDTDLIGPDGAGTVDDSGFDCSSCRWDGDD